MRQKKCFSLEELATYTGCQLIGNPHHQIYNVADLESATEEDASFLANPRYKQTMATSQAGVIFIDKQVQPVEGKNYLITEDPSKAFQQLIDTFHPQRKYPSGFSAIHPTAVVHESAQIGAQVTICPHAVIDENVIIGSHTFICAGVYIGPDSVIGEECIIHAHVVIREQCAIGNRVVIQPGAVIGSCGFGYTTDKQGKHTKLNQVGNVIIEDDVEIGANTTIDRARFKSTIVEQGSKIDNLVQLGHAAHIGSHNIIVAQTGIAGSTSTGKHVVLAGHVAVAGHLHLEDGVMVAGKSGVTKSLSTGKYGGFPAVPLNEYNRNAVFLRNIEAYAKEIKNLDSRLKQLEDQDT
jgi:UDP-3-O-[3-hydroxymyristoyl] glucosamine N-acyltransferase